MIAVLDVSATIEILLQKEKRGLFNDACKDASWLIAPDLYISEISNILWKYYKAKVVTHYDCVQYTADGIGLIDDFVDSKELWKEALGEGSNSGFAQFECETWQTPSLLPPI